MTKTALVENSWSLKHHVSSCRIWNFQRAMNFNLNTTRCNMHALILQTCSHSYDDKIDDLCDFATIACRLCEEL